MAASKKKTMPAAGHVIVDTGRSRAVTHPTYGVIIRGPIKVVMVGDEPAFIPSP